MTWSQFPLGPVGANAYLFANQAREAIVIDPGAEGNRLISNLQEQGLQPVAIMLTHAHFDHIGAADKVRKQWAIPVYLHQNEKDWPGDPKRNGSVFFSSVTEMVTAEAPDILIKGEGALSIGSFSFQVLETPGHSPGGISLYDRDEGVVFTGDALFSGSIGRTDLPGGDFDRLIQNIREKLLLLPEDTVVAPGHGPQSTISKEKQANPFFK